MEIRLQLESDTKRLELFGSRDSHLRMVRQATGAEIVARSDTILITGAEEAMAQAGKVIDQMQKRLVKRGRLREEDVKELLTQLEHEIQPADTDAITVYSHKAVIEPFTRGQLRYIETMQKNDLTFCTGPAGTGKTYLAVAVAVSMLKKRQIRKIVLARPAVEAGEKLGFLPGDLQAKVNPYLRPLFDSLEDMMEFSQMRKFMEMDIIEVIPLAFMRGRTLNEAVVICDEAQNTSPSQMLMVLTRLGRESKMIITGDTTQTDLERGQVSGMIDAQRTLRGIRGIGFVELDEEDIVRHKLVQNIVNAYERRKTLGELQE
ncbi:MAG: PhoH family protein [Sedimentisphaerales bacterium]|nr:PhoH family protein [Sedimentisphaerales bacterium]